MSTDAAGTWAGRWPSKGALEAQEAREHALDRWGLDQSTRARLNACARTVAGNATSLARAVLFAVEALVRSPEVVAGIRRLDLPMDQNDYRSLVLDLVSAPRPRQDVAQALAALEEKLANDDRVFAFHAMADVVPMPGWEKVSTPAPVDPNRNLEWECEVRRSGVDPANPVLRRPSDSRGKRDNREALKAALRADIRSARESGTEGIEEVRDMPISSTAPDLSCISDPREKIADVLPRMEPGVERFEEPRNMLATSTISDLSCISDLEEQIADILTSSDGARVHSSSKIAEAIQARFRVEVDDRRVRKTIKVMREREWPIETTNNGSRIPPSRRDALPAEFRQDRAGM